MGLSTRIVFTHSELPIPVFLAWQTTLHCNNFSLFCQPNQQFQTKPNTISQWLINNYGMLPV